VGERDERGREDLGEAESAAAVGAAGLAAGDGIREPGREEGHKSHDDRRDDRRQDDLGHHDIEVDGLEPDADDRGPDQAAEERVARAGRQAAQPGDQVPDDRADQAGEDELRGDQDAVLTLLDHAAGNCLGDLRGQERADQVEHGRDGDGDLRLHRAGGDGGRHRVRGVMESVGEVEDQRQRDDQHNYQGEFRHAPQPSPGLRRK
jgi:hypothetical protein